MNEEIEAWIARDKSGELWSYNKKPEKHIEYGTWGTTDNCLIEVNPDLFPNIKWQDPEPTKILIKIIK